MCEAYHFFIFNKPYQFKLCKNVGEGEVSPCNTLNYQDRTECRCCGGTDFQKDGEGVPEWIEESYDFYRAEGYSETEIDNIETEV